jgi:hypothetical protein
MALMMWSPVGSCCFLLHLTLALEHVQALVHLLWAVWVPSACLQCGASFQGSEHHRGAVQNVAMHRC